MDCQELIKIIDTAIDLANKRKENTKSNSSNDVNYREIITTLICIRHGIQLYQFLNTPVI